MAILFCPSDPGSHIDDASLGATFYATTSYGTCDGNWYVYQTNWPSMGPLNGSMFGPNFSRSIAMITDGTSNSIMASEGYIGHGQYRSCMSAGSFPSDPSVGTFSPTNVPPPGPASRSAVQALIASCNTKKTKLGGPISHTRWCNGGVYYSGFTTALTPNSKVLAVSKATNSINGATVNASNFGQNVPQDWDSVDENDGGPTYMALTASSYHSGGINVLFGDGNVRFVKDSVDPVVWRALGTIAGGEAVSGDQF
jgi:prepilin-type processing-associated H-X9-DG protein